MSDGRKPGTVGKMMKTWSVMEECANRSVKLQKIEEKSPHPLTGFSLQIAAPASFARNQVIRLPESSAGKLMESRPRSELQCFIR